MVELIKSGLELLAGYSVRWRTRGGFVRVLLVLVVSTLALADYADLPKVYTSIALAVVAACWFFAWIIGSGRLAVPSSNPTVVFAIVRNRR